MMIGKFGLSALVPVLVMCAAPLFAASPLVTTGSIGIATTTGTVSVNHSDVAGNSELIDGSRLETTGVPADIHLASGADIRLATRSAGSFFADHVSLDHGALRVGSFNGLTVDAAQLQITSDDATAKAVVRVTKKTIEVASVGGSVNVLDSGLLTRVAAGTKMSFQQTSANTPDPSNNSSNTGANPSPKSRMPSDQKTFLWVIGITAVAALAIGLTAAAQGKSPFH